MAKIRVGIVGITGYTGEELIRILLRHTGAEITALCGRTSAETRPLKDVYPHFDGTGIVCEPLDAASLAGKTDVVFLALPHRVSFGIVPELLDKNIKVIDLSADFRLNDPAVYERWYGEKHTAPSLLGEAVYGLTELNRGKIRAARLVANPGCYPTTILLALAPLLAGRIGERSSIIIDAKSGISGAGRKTVAEYYKNEHPNFRPYSIGGTHRHIPEIEQELSKIAGEKITVTFTPHILPMERGMVSTIYISTGREMSAAELRDVYASRYGGEPFIRFMEEGKIPDVRNITGTNYCDIGAYIDARARRLVIVSAIDNLVKGASGQAVQNMNVMFGIKETEGLEVHSVS